MDQREYFQPPGDIADITKKLHAQVIVPYENQYLSDSATHKHTPTGSCKNLRPSPVSILHTRHPRDNDGSNIGVGVGGVPLMPC